MRFGIRSFEAVVTGGVLLSYGMQSSGFSLSEYLSSVTSTDLVYFLFSLMVFFSFSVLGVWPFNAKLS